MTRLQELEKELELDIQELKCLMNSYALNSDSILIELLRRNILQMQKHSGQFLQILESNSMQLPPETVENAPQQELLEAETCKVEKPIEKEEPQSEEEDNNNNGRQKLTLTLNDSFRFARELFHGDNESMSYMLEQITAMPTYETAMELTMEKLDLEKDKEVFNDFTEVIKQYFRHLK